MTRFQTIISNALKESLSDIYITGGHPMVSKKLDSIQFHSAIKWSPQEVDDLVRSLLNSRQLDALRQRKSFDYAMSIAMPVSGSTFSQRPGGSAWPSVSFRGTYRRSTNSISIPP